MHQNIHPPSFIVNSSLGKRLSSAPKAASRIIIPVIILIILAAIVAASYGLRALTGVNQALSLTGTIEATEIHLGSEVAGRVDSVDVKEGDRVQAGQVLAVVRGERIRSPIDGTIIGRILEPGEIAVVGSTVIIVSNLDGLKLTVYVPEDRYGQIILGQNCQVQVDSFPNDAFLGKVTNIADRAEFTPRNVQTVEGRKTTVFAIRLDLASFGGKLKPGMPADVLCDFAQ
jgi:multidrug resistance efflux pump